MNKKVTWSVESNTRAPVTSTIDQDGTLHVSETEANTTLIVKAVSEFNPSKFDTAEVTILEKNEVVSVTVAPDKIELYPNSQKQFTAMVESTGTVPTTVSWNVIISGDAIKAEISSKGVLTIASDSAEGEFIVRAVSTHNSSKFGEAVVTIVKPPEIDVLLNGEKTTSVKVEPNQKVDILAQVINDNRNLGVTWSATDESFYTKTSDKDKYNITVKGDAQPNKTSTITATSIADTSKTATYTITVKQPPFLDVQPNEAVVKQGEELELTCIIKGFDNENLTWSVEGGTGETKVTQNPQDKKKAILFVDKAQSPDTPLKVKCEGKPNAETEAISDIATVNVEVLETLRFVPIDNPLNNTETLLTLNGFAFFIVDSNGAAINSSNYSVTPQLKINNQVVQIQSYSSFSVKNGGSIEYCTMWVAWGGGNSGVIAPLQSFEPNKTTYTLTDLSGKVPELTGEIYQGFTPSALYFGSSSTTPQFNTSTNDSSSFSCRLKQGGKNIIIEKVPRHFYFYYEDGEVKSLPIPGLTVKTSSPSSTQVNWNTIFSGSTFKSSVKFDRSCLILGWFGTRVTATTNQNFTYTNYYGSFLNINLIR